MKCLPQGSEVSASFETTFSALFPKLLPVVSRSFELTFASLEPSLLPSKASHSKPTHSKPTFKSLSSRSPLPFNVSIKNTKAEANSESINETARYLYDLEENRYIDWCTKLTSYSLRKNLAKTEDDAEDLARSFMVWLIKKDKLQGRTDAPVMYHWVQGQMFVQWVQRTREKEGQDGLSRHRNKYARTQQERKKGHFIFTPSRKASTAVLSTDEGGRVTSQDYFFEEDSEEAFEELHRKEVQDLIFKAFASSSKTDEEAKLLHRVYEEMADKTFYSDTEWAESWAMDVSEIKSLKKQVRESLRSNQALTEIYS